MSSHVLQDGRLSKGTDSTIEEAPQEESSSLPSVQDTNNTIVLPPPGVAHIKTQLVYI